MPKAFLSHATADQGRFVQGLAERLQANGVETWYARWELLDGDSLTQRIFEEGIGQADIVIAVVSENSINSQWVKAELGVGKVREIEQKCRLIPIVLDGVEAPVSLQDTLQRRIADVDNYDDEFAALLRSIFNQPTMPPLGRPPAYTTSGRVRGLTPSDAAVFVRAAGRALHRRGVVLRRRCCAFQALHPHRAQPQGDHRGRLCDGREGFIKEAVVRGETLSLVQGRPRLLREYIAGTRDVDALERQLIAEIVNQGADFLILGPIAERVGVPPVVAYAVLEHLSPRMFQLSVQSGGVMRIARISPLLARRLD